MRVAWDAQPVFKPPQWLGTLTSLGAILIHVKGTILVSGLHWPDHCDGQPYKHCVDCGCREDLGKGWAGP